jgi:hypothetical protein
VKKLAFVLLLELLILLVVLAIHRDCVWRHIPCAARSPG